MFTAGDIAFDKMGMILKPGGWIYLTSVGGDMELVEKVLAWGKEKGRKVFWNPGGQEISKLKSQNSKPQLKTQNFPNILQLNRKEASDFFGVNFVDEEIWKAEHCSTSPETILIITDGSHGGRICSRGICSWYKGIKTKMVDSTGAGDAFGSGFVIGLMKGKSIEESIELGKKQAANVVRFI